MSPAAPVVVDDMRMDELPTVASPASPPAPQQQQPEQPEEEEARIWLKDLVRSVPQGAVAAGDRGERQYGE